MFGAGIICWRSDESRFSLVFSEVTWDTTSLFVVWFADEGSDSL